MLKSLWTGFQKQYAHKMLHYGTAPVLSFRLCSYNIYRQYSSCIRNVYSREELDAGTLQQAHGDECVQIHGFLDAVLL